MVASPHQEHLHTLLPGGPSNQEQDRVDHDAQPMPGVVDGGQVDVYVGRDADTVTLRVSDTGIGMSREETDRLFNDFVRIKNARTKDILGSGLGLSTLKKLAKLYGGDVSVESEPDVGTTFTVVLRDAEEPVREAE